MTQENRKSDRRKGPTRAAARRERAPKGIVSTRGGGERRSKDRRAGDDRRQAHDCL